MIAERDFIYCGIPWRAGGRTREGVDCAGLARLFLHEEMGIDLTIPDTTEPGKVDAEEALKGCRMTAAQDLQRGDLIFFRHIETQRICHVAICLGGAKILHIVKGDESRIDNGFKLTQRMKLRPCAAVSSSDTVRLAAALSDPVVGEVGIVTLLVLSILLAVASYALSPKLGRLGNKYGRYGFDALVTQNSPEVPLPDLLGSVVVAGNSPYTQQSEKSASATAASQKANKIIILASAPSEEIDYQTGLKINGLAWNDIFFNAGSTTEGIWIDPAQTKAEAVTGTINGDSNVPSVSLYDGAYGIAVDVDVRAQYDREFPLYGFSGCSYMVFRLIDSTKFQNFNVTTRVKCRKCRTFDESGFIQTNETTASLGTGDGSTVRWKLPYEDVIVIGAMSIPSLATDYYEMSASNQTGNVYLLNRTKGYVEFLTAPASGLIQYTAAHYEREWSQNPAMQIVYLLTEKGRGLGLTEDKIDWPSFVDFRDFCDASITYQSATGEVTGPRWVTNYAVDFRKPIQEHIQAILDGCHAILFPSGGKFVIASIGAGTSVFSFTTANILEGSFASELIDRAERANRIKVLYHSEETHNAEAEVIVDHAADQAARSTRMGNNGVVDANLKLEAVTSPSQAERIAMAHLEEEVGGRNRARFKTTLKGLALQKGDVIDVTHPCRPSWSARLMRIEDLSHDEDDRLEITALDYTPGAYL